MDTPYITVLYSIVHAILYKYMYEYYCDCYITVITAMYCTPYIVQ